ncbi:MAG: NapC/NirT family cytochrome c [Anaerolineales bacterium]|nr:NapC/NirT family cytochrome c [Anaerolineales bacterium]
MLPYLTLIIVFVILLAGGMYGWEYSNSTSFCGTACHTMPPQSVVHADSPHANVTCEECHIGRASFSNQLLRKTQGLKETYYEIFKLYEYPIRATALRPARDTCEKCHLPETFAHDSLRTIKHFASDEANTEINHLPDPEDWRRRRTRRPWKRHPLAHLEQGPVLRH